MSLPHAFGNIMEIKTLILANLEMILSFEQELLEKINLDPMKKKLLSWKASWREESLEHYLPTGWCFGFFNPDNPKQLLGYYLAQPILFYRGLTQNLWVEHIALSRAWMWMKS